MIDAYEPDGSRLSPSLVVQKPSLKLTESPPPFVTRDELDATKHPTFEGTSLDFPQPNRPDIANYEKENPHFPHGWVGADYDPLPKTKLKNELPESEPLKISEYLAKGALSLLDPETPMQKTENVNPPLDKETLPQEPIKHNNSATYIPPNESSIKAEPLSPTNSQRPTFSGISERKSPEVSPLRKYAIPAPKGSSQDLLPALQTPSPQSATANSPENHHYHHHQHNLPSLQTALGEIPSVPPKDPVGRVNGPSAFSLHPVTAPSPSLPRVEPVWDHQRPGQFAPPQVPPSPYSHLSPASSKEMSAMPSPAASQQPYWRPLKSDISYLTTSTYELAAKSPATNYPTPTDHQTPNNDRPLFNPNAQPNGMILGTFKCRHPGCNALPFQTQYLLNSHANVHSQDRPHFCPIEGCPRGVGGKGFKRKNEMIRHGLVHNSPGYVCPFCPDQQHKYPRPDNLQRHVRVHHVDKNKDDPELRQVLSQRPEGSSRGRRRRTNVQ